MGPEDEDEMPHISTEVTNMLEDIKMEARIRTKGMDSLNSERHQVSELDPHDRAHGSVLPMSDPPSEAPSY